MIEIVLGKFLGGECSTLTVPPLKRTFSEQPSNTTGEDTQRRASDEGHKECCMNVHSFRYHSPELVRTLNTNISTFNVAQKQRFHGQRWNQFQLITPHPIDY